VETARTDEQGRYKTRAWTKPHPKDFTVKHGSIRVFAYKPSHEWRWNRSSTTDPFLSRVSEKGADRLEYLSRVISNTSCISGGESNKNLYRLDLAIYQEALSVARTDEDKLRAERFGDLAERTLVDESKPTTYDKQGRFRNIDPNDSFRREDLK
jgi:hypothetical protein